MARILLGEPQADLANAMKELFSLGNHTVQLENNGLRMLESLRQDHYDVIILETALPGLDGISVIRGYRATGGTTPILLMAGSHSSDELQCGLDAGADAYLVRPFRLHDVAAQVRAALRRPALRSENVLTVDGIALDSVNGTVTKDNVPIHLLPMQFKLLQFLMRHPNQVFSAHALYQRVWQKDFGLLEDTVRTHVRTLRQKIDSAGYPSLITTVRGFGYKISTPDEAQQTRLLAIVGPSDELLTVADTPNVSTSLCDAYSGASGASQIAVGR